MIFCSCLDGFGAVELLECHYAHQVVREGHRTEGQTEIRRLLHRRVDPERRPDQKTRLALSVQLDLRQLVGKLLGRKRRRMACATFLSIRSRRSPPVCQRHPVRQGGTAVPAQVPLPPRVRS